MNLIIDDVIIGVMRESIADTPPLDDSVVVDLIKEPFVATEKPPFASLVLADFPGYVAKTSAAAAELIFDPLDGKWYLELPDPLGGWSWTRASGAGDPQTIYGVAITDLGCANISPVLITNEGDNVSVGNIRIPLPIFS